MYFVLIWFNLEQLNSQFDTVQNLHQPHISKFESRGFDTTQIRLDVGYKINVPAKSIQSPLKWPASEAAFLKLP